VRENISTNEKSTENFYRRKAKRLGLMLRRSRAKSIHINDLGGYMILDAGTNFVIAGERWSFEIGDVQEYLEWYEGELLKSEQEDNLLGVAPAM